MPYFFNSNHTGFCQTPEVISKISKLTASYTAGNDGGQELMTMVSGPIIMFILIALFLCGTFDVRAVLSPNLRLLLSSALALFLPVMSYLFSEAKDAAGGGGGCQRPMASEDLSVRARVILTWMLLVELLRKKVDEVRMWASYSSSIQRAGRVVWLGSLVYFNITSPGRKAVFSILWILCATKLLQRIIFTDVEKRSYPDDKSWLISSYMRVMLERRHRLTSGAEVERLSSGAEVERLSSGAEVERLTSGAGVERLTSGAGVESAEVESLSSGAEVERLTSGAGVERLTSAAGVESAEVESLSSGAGVERLTSGAGVERLTSGAGVEHLKRCKYIVTGEEKLVGLVTAADGYNTDDHCRPWSHGGIITVGKVWQLADTDTVFNQLDSDQSIRRVCLSFALFKLLRRRFEHLPPMTPQETRNCRELFLSVGPGDDDGALFMVMADEVNFLCEHYHSVVPIVLASPLFVLVNYFLVPIAVLALCIIAVAVCGRGDVSHALRSMSADNYALQPGFAKLAICALVRAGHSRPAFLFTLYLLVTILLFIIFFFDEIWEFLTVLISNWFIISMVCNYVNKPNWFIISTFRWTLWLRRKMSKYTNFRLKQFSLLSPPLLATLVPDTLYLNVTSVPMTSYLKQSFGKILVRSCGGRTSIWADDPLYSNLVWARDMESDTEVILTLHIATCILEIGYPARSKGEDMLAAVSLSKYCAYLVVFHPELLPERRAKAELVLKEAKKELRKLLGFWGYYLSLPRSRAQKLLDSTQADIGFHTSYWSDEVVHRGMILAKQLYEEVFRVDEVAGWKFVSEVWADLLLYAAPAPKSDVHVKAHADILVEGVELVTVLWVFAMHTGMERPFVVHLST